MNVQHLGWDSDFFRIPIGRSDSSNLAKVAGGAREMALRCVYIETSESLDGTGFDLRLTDRRVVLERAAGVSEPPETVRAASAADRTGIDPLLDRLAPWSRFARDPGFGVDAARRMYEAWLDRSLSDELVGVIERDGSIRGFVTVNAAIPTEIGLIAVTENDRGYASALIRWAGNCAAPAPLRVATQSDNERALALYKRNGFVRIDESFVYHLWLNDNESHD